VGTRAHAGIAIGAWLRGAPFKPAQYMNIHTAIKIQ